MVFGLPTVISKILLPARGYLIAIRKARVTEKSAEEFVF